MESNYFPGVYIFRVKRVVLIIVRALDFIWPIYSGEYFGIMKKLCNWFYQLWFEYLIFSCKCLHLYGAMYGLIKYPQPLTTQGQLFLNDQLLRATLRIAYKYVRRLNAFSTTGKAFDLWRISYRWLPERGCARTRCVSTHWFLGVVAVISNW